MIKQKRECWIFYSRGCYVYDLIWALCRKRNRKVVSTGLFIIPRCGSDYDSDSVNNETEFSLKMHCMWVCEGNIKVSFFDTTRTCEQALHLWWAKRVMRECASALLNPEGSRETRASRELETISYKIFISALPRRSEIPSAAQYRKEKSLNDQLETY